MPNPPKNNVRYDEYEPGKYNCISVNDDFIEKIDCKLNNIDFYWHTLDVKGKGIAYCGVTLIPPSSSALFLQTIDGNKNLSDLYKLLKKAVNENKWVIHFGL